MERRPLAGRQGTARSFGSSIMRLRSVLVFFSAALGIALAVRAAPPIHVSVDWSKTDMVSRTAPTLMMEVHPLLRQGRSLHKAAFSAIRELNARYVRYHAQSMW